MLKIKPNNRILVKQIKTEQTETANGLISLPSTTDREAKTQGKIMAVDKRLKGFKVGQIVIYGQFAGEKAKVMEKDKEQEYILLQDEEILGWLC